MNKDVLGAVEKIHKIFKDKKLTLSVAESCTGGLISNVITTLPGASVFFRGGVIAYSVNMKRTILGVSSETIKRYGVISKETAKEMAERVRLLIKTDYAISTSGNLGPDVLEGKEQGLIYISACREAKTVSRELRLTGTRGENKEEAVLAALRLLIEVVEANL